VRADVPDARKALRTLRTPAYSRTARRNTESQNRRKPRLFMQKEEPALVSERFVCHNGRWWRLS
jgi:hypothetical protein